MSPLLAREITFRALGQAPGQDCRGGTPHASSGGGQVPALASRPVRGDPIWQPTVVLEEDQVAVYAPYPLTHRGEPQAMPSMSQAIEAYTRGGRQHRFLRRGQAPRPGVHLQGPRPPGAPPRVSGSFAEAGRPGGPLAPVGGVDPGLRPHHHPGPDGTGGRDRRRQTAAHPAGPARYRPADNAQACFARYRKAQRAIGGRPGPPGRGRSGLARSGAIGDRPGAGR